MTLERDYDDLHNEGGEGYNPHREARLARERAAACSQPRTRYDILRDLERVDCSTARESGTYDQARVDGLNAELAALTAAGKAGIEAAGWTLETTRARQARWNERVNAGEITPKTYQAAQQEQGWTLADLKDAIRIHKLPRGA